MDKITNTRLLDMKSKSEKIVSLTAYDYSFASVLDTAGVDVILVGDSLGNVIQGRESTVPVTMDEMVYHSRCVANGCRRALLVTDLPFMSYQASIEQALLNAGRLMKEGGAEMVKLEGGAVMVDTVKAMTDRGIPVCGHLGLQPQSVFKLGGYKVQGRDPESAERMQRDAVALQDAGASLLVLEAVPSKLAAAISQELAIPTIGIGAGVDTDGQVLVLQDMLGIYPKPSPKFSKNFMQGAADITAAVRAYVDAVRNGQFPAAEHSFD